MKALLVLVPSLLAASSGLASPRQNLEKVATPELGAQCDDLDLPSFAGAVDAEATILEGMSGTLTIGEQRIPYARYAKETLRPLAELARTAGGDFCAKLAEKFTFYRNPGAGVGQFTVYNNPVVKASRTRAGAFQYPLYRHPEGKLGRLATGDIMSGKLDGKGYELVYLDDPTLQHAIQIEGSATLLFDDGQSLRLTCDGSNGHKYTNIGKLLLADHKIPADQVTPLGMTRARKYFLDHPDEFRRYWARDPHYVFFKESDSEGVGSYGALIPGRSVAVDPRWIPLGAAVWIRSEKPVLSAAGDEIAGWASYGRVALGQDKGVAIVGPARVDVFFGSTDYAQAASASTNKPGEIYVLLAK